MKRGLESISADTVGTLMVSHLLTRCNYELFDCHKARRHSEELSNRELSATSCRSTKLAFLDAKYSHDREVHLVSTPRSNKISLPLLFASVVAHSFYLVSRKNTFRFISNLGSSGIKAMINQEMALCGSLGIKPSRKTNIREEILG